MRWRHIHSAQRCAGPPTLHCGSTVLAIDSQISVAACPSCMALRGLVLQHCIVVPLFLLLPCMSQRPDAPLAVILRSFLDFCSLSYSSKIVIALPLDAQLNREIAEMFGSSGTQHVKPPRWCLQSYDSPACLHGRVLSALTSTCLTLDDVCCVVWFFGRLCCPLDVVFK